MRFHKLKTMGLVCLVVFSFDFTVRGEYYHQLIENSIRRVRSLVEIPERYREIVDQLNHPNPDKRIEAIGEIKEIVINQEKDERIRGTLALKVADKLSDPNGFVREEAVDALGKIIPSLKQESLKEELALKVADKMDDPRGRVCWIAASALGKIIPSLKQESLKEKLVLKVVDKLNDPDENMCGATINVLSKIIPCLKQESLKERIALQVADILNDSSGIVCKRAISALGKIIPSLKQESLKEELALKVADMLSDPNGFVREEAVDALGEIIPFLKQESLKKELALKVADKLSDPDENMCGATINALSKIIPCLKEESVKEGIALQVADMLSDPEWRLRWEAVSALGEIIPSLRQESLKEELALKVADMLSDPHCDVCKVVVSALGKIIPSLRQESLKEELALKVADKRTDPNKNMCKVALSALGKIIPCLKQESLKEELALIVVDMLTDPNKSVCKAAVSALEEIIPYLKEESLKELILKITEKLSDPNEDVYVQEAASIPLGKIISNGGESIEEYIDSKEIVEVFKLFGIEFADGGDSPSSFSSIFEGMLTRDGKEPISLECDIDIPDLSEDIIKKASIDELLAEAGMEGAEFYKVQGRSIIFRKGNRYIRVKLMKSNETYSDFIREAEIQIAIQRNKSELGLESSFPTPIIRGNQAIFSFNKGSLSEEIQQKLNEVIQQHIQAGKEFRLKEIRGHYVAVVDIAEDEGYFNYLNNKELSDEEFLQASKKSMRDLMKLAKHGLFHTALVDLFHNVEQRGRPDRGRYLWMSDIIRQMATRSGAGRLNAWRESVKYPNCRESGIADWEHVYTLEDIMNNENVAPWLSPLDRFGNKKEKFYVANYLGDYMLTFALLTADRMFRRGELDWQNPDKLANILKEIFMAGYREFTGKEDIADSINWDRMAKQIAFFCSNAYVGYVAPNADRRYIPEGIYSAGTEVRFGAYREGTWSDEIGWSNAQGHRHLGPTNGPIPLQELIRTLYIMTAYMVSEYTP